jgi:putative peptidoglycan lipid II flippase
MGALNAMQHFLWPAAAPVVYNLAIILAAWLLVPRLGVAGLAWGVVLGAAGHFLVQLPQLRRAGARYSRSVSLADADVREVLRLMGPRVLGLFFVQMHFLVNTILASKLAAGSLSALNYAWLIMLLPQGVFALSLATAAFPTFSAQVALGRVDAMRATFGQTLRAVLFLSVPAAVGLIVFGRLPVQALLQRGEFTAASTALVTYALAFYALGLTAHGALEIVVRAFYALHNTWTPVLVGVGAMALNILLSLALVRPLSFGGLALANSTATTLEALFLLLLLRPRLGGIEGGVLLRSLARILAASALMGALLFFLGRALPPVESQAAAIGFAAGGILAGALLYLTASWALRSPELHQVAGLVRRRLAR